LEPVKILASRRFSVLLIVSMASACDNVEWGGIEVRRQGPPATSVGVVPDTAGARQDSLELLPTGPVLYMAERDSSGLRLMPVGAIVGDSLVPFPSEQLVPGYRARFVRELLPRGAEFVLFSAGVRVGGFTVQTVETDESFCVARPAARGVIEMIPEAMTQTRFLALPRAHASRYEWGALQVMEADREQRDATLSLPAVVLGQLRAERSPNIVDMRWDMQTFLPNGVGPAWVAASYLFRDRMRIETPPPSAYSLFLLATPGTSGYETVYSWYRQVAQEGKGAARLFEQFDWSGDGQTDMLLEVLGEDKRWVAALEMRGGQWTRVYEDPCGAAASPITAN
jgi:hypothetical protein